MPTKFNLISGTVIALTAVWGIKTKIQAVQNARLFLEAAQGCQETQRANEAQISYLCHLLEEHEVPVDEFDLIALNYNQ